jgi:hypothetical protein
MRCRMFILIEIDKDWTWGIDWGEYTKGLRLGFVAVHICKHKFTDFIKVLSKHYHQERIK